jgi:hypothetical protein
MKVKKKVMQGNEADGLEDTEDDDNEDDDGDDSCDNEEQENEGQDELHCLHLIKMTKRESECAGEMKRGELLVLRCT